MTILDSIPAERRDSVQTALAAAFGAAPVTALHPVAGGASGALAFRAEVAGRAYLLRLEMRRGALRNPHQYTAMKIAAAAGIAPPVHHADDAAGIAIMDFLPQHELSRYPDGPEGLAQAAGHLLARLQATPRFPHLMDYLPLIARMLGFVRGSALFVPGLLDPHAEGFERIRAAYPWDAAALVSSHNDPNPRNILFDGARLWLIDWETAHRNDPLADAAIMADQLAATPQLEAVLLHAWLGRAPDRALLARLVLMRVVTRIYYACLGFSALAAAPRGKPDDDLTAPTPEEFRAAFAQGRLTATGPQTLYILGKVQLAGFLAALAAPGFEEALAIVRRG